MTIRAKFDGRVFVPEEPVELPVGEHVLVSTEPIDPSKNASTSGSLKRLSARAKRFGPVEDSPGDGAAQHDHYLYGTPKRKDA